MSTFRIKTIQINIYKGRYLPSLLSFLKKEDPDFITMQEVTEGSMNLSVGFGGNIFNLLKNELGMFGVHHFDLLSDDGAKMGNAVFGKYKITGSNVLALKAAGVYKRAAIDDTGNFEHFPRHLIDAVFDFHGKNIHVMSWHGAWVAPPQDSEETLRQSAIVASYSDKIKEPYIIGGDLNALIDSKTVDQINTVANNLLIGTNALQSTHPKTHKIVPKGYLVDYVFCSRDFHKISVSVPEVDISDHLPVVAELEINF